MVNVFGKLIVAGVCVAAPLAAVDAEQPADKSTRVTATVVLPQSLASFSGRTLELRLYEFDPLLADASADLIERIAKSDFSHKQGEETRLKIVIGAEGRVQDRRQYYLTTFVLDEDRRTHIGERDGKPGLTKVLTDGNPREVVLIVRPVR